MTALTVAALASVILRSGPAAAQSRPIRLVALGDSLTAGYGLGPREGFAPRLETALRARSHDVRVANAGVSGDTAEAGAQRVDWSVPDGTDGVIVELGANDMLRGLDPARTRAALTRILDRLKQRNIPAMLAGMRASPNLGADYVRRFDSIYPDLARERGLVLYPFFLEGVVGDRTLNLQDGIHPTARGIDIVVEKITPSVERFLAEIAARRS
ncbi:arylesterase [Methylopila turkensis]|uniref:arylesterase n=1 Tax=Methylopila turkensis TaxID=1437816 RepID=UPI0022F2D190|nr:arylesterase [Methylopila turkensis]